MMHVVSLILSMLFSVSQTKIIESQYSLLRNLPKISISFPNENSQVTLNLNTYLPFTFFSRSSLIAAINDTLYENSTVYLIKNYSSFQYESTIKFDDEVSINAPFYISRNSVRYEAEGIGLAYKFQNESFSIIHQLYNNKHIEHMLFAFSAIKNVGTFYLGGIPSQDLSSFKEQGKCKVDDKSNEWRCQLSKMSFEHYSVQLNTPAMFVSTFRSFFTSDILFDFMTHYVLKDSLSTICQEKITTESYLKYIKCTKEIMKNNNIVIFEFDNVKMEFKVSEMFEEFMGSYLSLFESNPYPLFKGQTIFGIHFINTFNYTIFDYENKQISFYSDTRLIKTIKPNTVFARFGIMCAIFILCFSNILLIVYHNKVLFN